MTISQAVRDDLSLKLRMVGLPETMVGFIVSDLTRQIAAEGPENVVKRLKVLKQCALQQLAGISPKFQWIKHTRRGPKGPWRNVWRWLIGASFKRQKRALNAMMVYAGLVLPKRAAPTSTQERKFLESVAHSVDEVSNRERLLRENCMVGVFRAGFDRLRDIVIRGGWNPKVDNDTPDILEYLHATTGSGKDAVLKGEKRLNAFLGGACGVGFHAFPKVQQCLGFIGSDYFELTHPWNGAHLNWRDVIPSDDTPIGVIGSSQEPGYKFRAFASPHPVLQCALEGLKRNLQAAQRRLPPDASFDQESAVEKVQGWLSNGKTVHSVDLSDATNNFPFEIQKQLLEYLGVADDDVKLLELVSRSPYKVMWKDDTTVRWDVGQPLGAGPSFMAFSLAHIAVALDAEASVGIPTSLAGSTFLVLGDDFITCDSRVHAAYRERLRAMSCPVSEPKCLSSDLVGEFAGKAITKLHVFHGYKYKEVSDISFLSVVRTLGPQAINRKFLSEEQYLYCLMVRELPEPFGLGFNPKGRPYADRYQEYLELESLRKNQSEPIPLSVAEIWNSWFYTAESRHYRYFRARVARPLGYPARRSREMHGGDDFAFTDGNARAELPVAPVVRGDPRPDPLQGWVKSARKRVRHLERQEESPETAKVRARARMAVVNGSSK